MNTAEKNRILVVDDDKINLLYLNNLLGPEYTLYIARSGEEAIKLACDYIPDLILLDIIMPGMNGYEVLEVLKKTDNTKDIPVIFITGLSSNEDEVKGLALGADDYIVKPFSDAVVQLRVRNQLRIINQMRLIIEKELSEKTSRAKSEFLSRMSHELRTPMNAIISMTSLARVTDEPAKKNDYLEKSASASRDLLRLVEDVLDVADLSDGKFKLSRAEFHFGEMLNAILRKSEHLIAKKHQSLLVESSPDIPEILEGDERRLAQVISSLLSNAIKFTPDFGSIKIKSSVIGTESDIVRIQIDVTDNGIGIPLNMQAGVFTIFEQADGGIDRKFGGTGMGLYLSKITVEKMDGEIWFDSLPGKGSKFSFTFAAQMKQTDDKGSAVRDYTGITTLLVDDIEINREIVMALLERTGMKFVCAENGREAVELFTSSPSKFGLILMDINMPEMDGVEATRRIRSSGTFEGVNIPIIAITANTNPDDVEGFLAAGMTAHLGKPADFGEILRTINSYIKL